MEPKRRLTFVQGPRSFECHGRLESERGGLLDSVGGDHAVKRFIAITLGLALVAVGGEARTHPSGYTPNDHRSYLGESNLVSQNSYINASGHRVHSPSRTFSGRD